MFFPLFLFFRCYTLTLRFDIKRAHKKLKFIDYYYPISMQTHFIIDRFRELRVFKLQNCDVLTLESTRFNVIIQGNTDFSSLTTPNSPYFTFSFVHRP